MTDSAETIWFGRISRFGTLGKKISAETERAFGQNFRQKYCRNDVRSHTNSLNVCTHEKHEDFVILAIRLVRVLA